MLKKKQWQRIDPSPALPKYDELQSYLGRVTEGRVGQGAAMKTEYVTFTEGMLPDAGRLFAERHA
jgi:hypothetical protein